MVILSPFSLLCLFMCFLGGGEGDFVGGWRILGRSLVCAYILFMNSCRQILKSSHTNPFTGETHGNDWRAMVSKAQGD